MAEITAREQRQIDQANSSGKTPVVFIHGLWLLPSSWDNWVGLFEENGYAGVTPSWPDDPETVAEARANPDVFAKKTLEQVADHTAKVIDQLDKKPAVMGHSTGGLLTYMIADRGLSAASVAIDPGPFRGVLPLPLAALKSASPVLRNPLNRGRAITPHVRPVQVAHLSTCPTLASRPTQACGHVCRRRLLPRDCESRSCGLPVANASGRAQPASHLPTDALRIVTSLGA